MTNNTNVLNSAFYSLPDPRDSRRVTYPLENILTIAICATMAGSEGWEDFERFGEAKRGVFATFLDMSAGVPKHDVYRRVFNALDPSTFQEVFLKWTRSILAKKLLGQIAIDGKCMRGSGDTDSGQSPLHMVSAWACDHSMIFSQVVTDEKSNEITAIPELLKTIPLKDTLVSIDAMGCQYAIAEDIIDGEGHYIFSLKGNQGTLHKDIKSYIEDARSDGFSSLPHDSATTREKNRGRQETRTVRIFTDIEWLRERHENWQHIQSAIVIERIRQTKNDSNPHRESFYYISNKIMDADKWLVAIRNHWQVENSLHWVLDVTFSEDSSQVHNRNGAENLSILRRIALNILKKDTTHKVSIRAKRKITGWSDKAMIDFLKQM